MDELIPVMGLPIFGNPAELKLWAPQGYVDACRRLHMEDEGDFSLAPLGELEEYLGVFRAARLRRGPYVLLAHERRVKGIVFERLHAEKALYVPWRSLDRHAKLTGYPRDLAVTVPGSGTLLVNACLKRRLRASYGGWKVVRSIWGEGGRIHIAGTTALICLSVTKHGVAREDVSDLHRAGIKKIISLPPNRYLVEWTDGTVQEQWDNHIDRFSGLCLATDGSWHLVMDPHCFAVSHKSFEGIKRSCEEAGVTVHVPEDMSVPLGAGFVQFSCGTVVMSAGESHLEKLLVELVGREKVLVSEVPVARIGSYMRAGIHCLFNELPESFVLSLIRKRKYM